MSSEAVFHHLPFESEEEEVFVVILIGEIDKYRLRYIEIQTKLPLPTSIFLWGGGGTVRMRVFVLTRLQNYNSENSNVDDE